MYHFPAALDFDPEELETAKTEREKQEISQLMTRFIINKEEVLSSGDDAAFLSSVFKRPLKPDFKNDYKRLLDLKEKHKDYILENRSTLLGNLDTFEAQSFLNSLNSKWRQVPEKKAKGGRSRKRKSKRKSKRNF